MGVGVGVSVGVGEAFWVGVGDGVGVGVGVPDGFLVGVVLVAVGVGVLFGVRVGVVVIVGVGVMPRCSKAVSRHSRGTASSGNSSSFSQYWLAENWLPMASSVMARQ